MGHQNVFLKYINFYCQLYLNTWRRKWQPTPVFLPGESHVDRRAWLAIVHGVTRVGHGLVTKPPNHHTSVNLRKKKENAICLSLSLSLSFSICSPPWNDLSESHLQTERVTSPDTWSATALILDFLTSRTLRNKWAKNEWIDSHYQIKHGQICYRR